MRAQILDVLRGVTAGGDMGLCVVSHDLGVIRYLCDTVIVMQNGKVVESGPVETVWNSPRHPYTEQLLQAVPVLGEALAGATGRQAATAEPTGAEALLEDGRGH
ncbi:hypothetical protein ACFQ2B_17475 [Streptomyces stramineus]